VKLPSRTVADQAAQYNFEKLERTIDPAPVTSLPTTDLYVGRRIVYAADAAAGVYWDLMLDDPSATYPWKYLGGGAMHDRENTDSGTGSAAFVDLAGGQPQVTLPLAGEYECSHGANCYMGAGAPATPQAGLFVTTDLAPGVANALIWRVENNGLQNWTLTTLVQFTATASGRIVKQQYLTNTGTAQFRWRWLRVTPIRVG